MAEKQALIVGAGYLGKQLTEVLLASNWQVSTVRRQSIAVSAVAKNYSADVVTATGFEQLPKNISALIYCVSASDGSPDAYEKAYVTGLSNVLQHYAGATLEHVVFVSSTAVYPQDSGETVDETSPVGAANFRGETLLRAESLLAASGLPHSVVRLSGIYGPGRSWLIEAAKRADELSADRYLNLIHRDDAAALISIVLAHHPLAEPIIGVDSRPSLRSEIYAWVREALGLPALENNASEPPTGRRLRSCLATKLGFMPAYPSYQQGLEHLL